MMPHRKLYVDFKGDFEDLQRKDEVVVNPTLGQHACLNRDLGADCMGGKCKRKVAFVVCSVG